MKWLSEVALAISEEYGTEYSDTRMKMWASMLKDYSEKQVKDALIGYMRSEKARFAPKVADIITMIEGSSADRTAMAERAWQRIMQNCDTTNSAIFDDPAIHYAVGITFGTWVKFGLMLEKDQPFRRKDFISAYCAWKDGLPYQPRLIGRIEASAATGEVVFSTKHIGDKEMCKIVEKGCGVPGIVSPLKTISGNMGG